MKLTDELVKRFGGNQIFVLVGISDADAPDGTSRGWSRGMSRRTTINGQLSQTSGFNASSAEAANTRANVPSKPASGE